MRRMTVVALLASAASASGAVSSLFTAANSGTPTGAQINLPGATGVAVGPLTLNGNPIGGTISDLASASGGMTAGQKVHALGTVGGQSGLFEVDPSGGALSFSGAITLAGFPLPTAGEGAIAAGPNGELHMAAVVGGSGGLYSLNASTGVATFRGSFSLAGTPVNPSEIIGLATSPSGNTFGLFTVGGVVNLFGINPSDASLTLIGSPNLLGQPLSGVFSDIAFDDAGTLYTTNFLSGGVTSLFAINTANAGLTLLGNVGEGVATDAPITGLAWVPAPGTLGVLGLMAGASIRRRR